MNAFAPAPKRAWVKSVKKKFPINPWGLYAVLMEFNTTGSDFLWKMQQGNSIQEKTTAVTPYWYCLVHLCSQLHPQLAHIGTSLPRLLSSSKNLHSAAISSSHRLVGIPFCLPAKQRYHKTVNNQTLRCCRRRADSYFGS